MTDQECDTVFAELVKFLNANGMDWIAEAVSLEIEEGKEVEKLVDYFDEVFSSLNRRPLLKKSGTKKITTYDEYNPKEKLRLLIDAIENIAVDTAFMEEAIIKELVVSYVGNSQAPTEVHFVPANKGSSHWFSSKTLKDRVESAKRLKQHLEALRNEI